MNAITKPNRLLARLIPLLLAVTGSLAGVALAAPPFRFVDDFEADQGWGLFEELVGHCYGTGIGTVERSTDVAFESDYSLRVWANQARSLKSNHLLANKKISDTGLTGRLRFQCQAFIAPETATTGETGPEFSMQNTRQIAPGAYRTSTAGIQYRANPFDTANYQNWAIWTEGATPGVAEWRLFRTSTPLVAGAWYYIAIEADYTAGRYVRFWLRGPGVDLSMDLSAYRIAPETKFIEEAFWITVESENLFNNCGTAMASDYKVYYDDVHVRRLGNGQ